MTDERRHAAILGHDPTPEDIEAFVAWLRGVARISAYEAVREARKAPPPRLRLLPPA